MDFKQSGLFTRAEAHADGFTDNELRLARKANEIYVVRPGCYVTRAVHKSMTRDAQHLMLARAVAGQSCGIATLSHVSAAVALGIDVWGIRLDKAQLTIDRIGSSKSSRRRMLHGTTFTDAECSTFDGLRFTKAARTVVDLARSLEFEKAVCAGDSALHLGLLTEAELKAALDSARTRVGVSKASRAVRFMSARSESVGESRSRVLIDGQDLPSPSLNEWVFDERGKPIGRVDFLFDGRGVIGEFDGAGKYGEEIVTVKKQIFAEKARENRLRELGWLVVRWDWSNLAEPDILGTQIRDALARTSHWPPPTGSHSPDRR